VACQAQLVNVIGAIFAAPGGPAWRQRIFHPFKIVTEHAHGSVLEAKIHCSQRETLSAGVVDEIVAAVVHDTAERKIVFFVLHRGDDKPVEVELHLRGFPPATDCQALELADDNLLAVNSAALPETVMPKEHRKFLIRADRIVIPLRPLSWNMFAVSY
jgi:alpha-L-arabinofuranosidase